MLLTIIVGLLDNGSIVQLFTKSFLRKTKTPYILQRLISVGLAAVPVITSP